MKKKKSTPRRPPSPPRPGFTQPTTVRFLIEHRQKLDQMVAEHGGKYSLIDALVEALERGFRSSETENIATGVARPAAERPPAAKRLLLFTDLVDISQFTDDQSIYNAMDLHPLKTWATGADAQCHHVNPQLVSYSGRTIAEFRSGCWQELIHPEDRSRVVETYLRAFYAQQSFQNTYRMLRADGRYGLVWDCAVTRYWPDQRFVGHIGTLHEIAAPGSFLSTAEKNLPGFSPPQAPIPAVPSSAHSPR